MRFFVAGFALFALAAAGSIPVEYLPPVQDVAVPTAEYLPPAELAVAEQPTILADDGYRYKTVKKLRLRHRRDVSEVVNQYLPPVQQEVVEVAGPVVEEVAPVVDSAVLADDGYRYKTVKKYRLRHRRDVNEVVNQYLPPVQQEVVEVAGPVLAPVEEVAPVVDSAVLADDGYRYKTVKKYRLRHRRDVNEVVNQYLPPVQQEVVEVAGPVVEELAPVVDSAVLADDGYRYKTVKKYRLRHRRDVNEVVNQYLPPVQQEVVEVAAPVIAPVEEVAPVVDSAVLADDGYRYKTVKKYRLRHRRDVNEVVNQYLPPVQQEVVEVAGPVIAPVEEVAPVVDSAVLADDGYRYKTVKKYRLRHRRDVNEVVNQYLPPVQQEVVEVAAPVIAPVEEVAPVVDSAVLADDGYRYKTVKKYRLRHRRDVNEVVNQYLPPVQQEVVEVAAPVIAPVEEVAPVVDSAVLADDGYRYKTVKKYRLRHRRDVNEVVNQYLPPVQQEVVEVAAPALAPVEEVAPVVDSAVLADDGYRYKTVKKYRLRHRRDVNEVVNQYLPPVQQEIVEVAAPVLAPVEEVAPVVDSAVLADDGYRYKTVKKYRLRHRRDVNEVVNQYLPPVQQEAIELAAPVVASVEEVAPVVDSAVLADDGYRYRTVKKYRLRHRRDVNEVVNQYLPPVQQEAVELASPIVGQVEEVAPVIESSPLAVDGYRYKTVKKLRYRHRH